MMITDSEKTLTTTARMGRPGRLGTRRLTRAHLALHRRPGLCAHLAGVADQVAEALGARLGCEVTARASLVDSSLRLDRALGRAEQALILLWDLDALDARCVMEVERTVAGALVDRLSGGSGRGAPASRLTRIEEAALGYLCLCVLQAAREDALVEQRFAPRLFGVNAAREEALELVGDVGPQVCVQITIQAAGVSGQARLFVPARAVQGAVQADAEDPLPEMSPEVAAAALSLRTFSGGTHLDESELEALCEGDVVMFQGLQLTGGHFQGPARLGAAGFELDGAFTSDGFALTRARPRIFPQESTMTDPVEEATLTHLPVEVEIELTRVRLTVAELAQLRPGGLLPLHINAAQPVLLRVGDRAVARAELVEIDGEVGARILTLLS